MTWWWPHQDGCSRKEMGGFERDLKGEQCLLVTLNCSPHWRVRKMGADRTTSCTGVFPAPHPSMGFSLDFLNRECVSFLILSQ